MSTYLSKLGFAQGINDILIAVLIYQKFTIAAMLFGYISKSCRSSAESSSP
jgi:hypothetical protein